jgi:hypothetical protein
MPQVHSAKQSGALESRGSLRWHGLYKSLGSVQICTRWSYLHNTKRLRGELRSHRSGGGGDCVSCRRVPKGKPFPQGGMTWCGARNGRVVTTAVRPPVRPATRWMRVVSRAAARLMAGRMVARRRASLNVPAPGGPVPRRPPAQARDALARPRACASYDPIRLDEEGWGKSSGPGLPHLEGGAQLENRGPLHTTRGSGGVVADHELRPGAGPAAVLASS